MKSLTKCGTSGVLSAIYAMFFTLSMMVRFLSNTLSETDMSEFFIMFFSLVNNWI